MTAQDLHAVEEIEGCTLSGWSMLSLQEELAVPHGLCLVAEEAQLIKGWCACRRIWPEAELLRVAVAEQQRKKGVGRLLLHNLCGDLRQKQYSSLFLEVRSQNETALGFYHRYGFLRVGVRRGYYAEPYDDALLLKLDI
jgi:ribosomal-protein-alanine N-acetyltransferase